MLAPPDSQTQQAGSAAGVAFSHQERNKMLEKITGWVCVSGGRCPTSSKDERPLRSDESPVPVQPFPVGGVPRHPTEPGKGGTLGSSTQPDAGHEVQEITNGSDPYETSISGQKHSQQSTAAQGEAE